MLLMVKKGIRAGIVHARHRYAKAIKTLNYHILCIICIILILSYLAHNLYGQGMSQKMPVHGSKGIKNVTNFDEDFMNNYDENSDKGYIPEVDVEYPKDLLNLLMIFQFQLKE